MTLHWFNEGLGNAVIWSHRNLIFCQKIRTLHNISNFLATKNERLINRGSSTLNFLTKLLELQLISAIFWNGSMSAQNLIDPILYRTKQIHSTLRVTVKWKIAEVRERYVVLCFYECYATVSSSPRQSSTN